MNRRWLMVGAVGAVALAFIAGVVGYKDRTAQQAGQAVQASGDALVRAHAPVFGNPQAQVTIVEFFDPSCETCRAFYPLVKSLVNASFGQVRLVVRYAPLHPGSDRAVQILEAARLQGKYWPAPPSPGTTSPPTSAAPRAGQRRAPGSGWVPGSGPSPRDSRRPPGRRAVRNTAGALKVECM